MVLAFWMFFLIFRNIEVNFNNWKLGWKLYTVAEALFITRRVELVRKKEIAIAALDPDDKLFVVYIASWVILSTRAK